MKPGEEPRRVLRYVFEAGETETLIFEMAVATREYNLGRKVQDIAAPPVRMTFEVESRAVTPEGNLEYYLELTAMDVVDDGETRSSRLRSARRSVAPLVGLTAWGIVTPSGEAVETHYSNPPGIPEDQRQLMESVQEQMGQMFAPLPKEPVGQGAIWKVTMPMETSQFDFTQQSMFWLQKLEGDYCEMTVTVKQIAEPQDMKELPPGIPEGFTIHLDNLESSGSGTQAFRLSDVGGTADVSLNLGMDFTIRSGANSQKHRSEVDMTLKIEPGGE